MRQEEELKNIINILEKEKKIKIQEMESEDKKKIKELEEALLKITNDKVYIIYFLFTIDANMYKS